MNVRRAIIFDGNVAEKKNHPEYAEIPQVSLLLEADRERRGIKNISRFTTLLVEDAIVNGHLDTWKAIDDDIFTNDLDISSVHSLFTNNLMLPTMFVTSLTQSKTQEEILYKISFFYKISANISDEIKEAISISISCQWKAFVDCLLKVSMSVIPKTKDSYLREISKFINFAQIGNATTADMMRELIKIGKSDMLELFLTADFNACVDDDLFVSMLKTRSTKNVHIIAVAKAVQENPDFGISHNEHIEKCITNTMGLIIRSGYGDRRVLNSLAFLTRKCFDDNEPAKNMATLLLWATAADPK